MRIRYGLLALGVAIAAIGPAQAQQNQEQSTARPQTANAGQSLTIAPSTLRQVQQALNRRGYDVGAGDGTWNEPTRESLRRYQQAQGLEPTGELDTRTLKSLGIGG